MKHHNRQHKHKPKVWRFGVGVAQWHHDHFRATKSKYSRTTDWGEQQQQQQRGVFHSSVVIFCFLRRRRPILSSYRHRHQHRGEPLYGYSCGHGSRVCFPFGGLPRANFLLVVGWKWPTRQQRHLAVVAPTVSIPLYIIYGTRYTYIHTHTRRLTHSHDSTRIMIIYCIKWLSMPRR